MGCAYTDGAWESPRDDVDLDGLKDVDSCPSGHDSHEDWITPCSLIDCMGKGWREGGATMHTCKERNIGMCYMLMLTKHVAMKMSIMNGTHEGVHQLDTKNVPIMAAAH